MKLFIVVAIFLAVQVVNAEDPECDNPCDPLDISLVIDNSQTVTEAGFAAAKKFIHDLLKNFNIAPGKSRVSLVTYGLGVYEDTAIGFDDHTSLDDLMATINAIDYRHGTRTDTGLALTYMVDNQMEYARRDVKRVAIVLTDGDSQNREFTASSAKVAHEKGIAVYAIGVGPKITMMELKAIASDSRHVIPTPSYDNLQDILNQLRVKICQETPEPPCRHSPTELMLVIDSSVSVGEEDFALGLKFVTDLLNSFEINPSTIRVAAVMFGSRVYDENAIHFDEYNSGKAVSAAIHKLPWMHGSRTETGMGIDYMVDNFVPHARAHAPKVAIVITDGESQNHDKTAASAKRARANGVKMVAVGIGRARTEGGKLNMQELADIAGTSSSVLLADNYADLERIRDELVTETCYQVVLAMNQMSLADIIGMDDARR